MKFDCFLKEELDRGDEDIWRNLNWGAHPQREDQYTLRIDDLGWKGRITFEFTGRRKQSTARLGCLV
jgi:hypothetical protein